MACRPVAVLLWLIVFFGVEADGTDGPPASLFCELDRYSPTGCGRCDTSEDGESFCDRCNPGSVMRCGNCPLRTRTCAVRDVTKAIANRFKTEPAGGPEDPVRVGERVVVILKGNHFSPGRDHVKVVRHDERPGLAHCDGAAAGGTTIDRNPGDVATTAAPWTALTAAFLFSEKGEYDVCFKPGEPPKRLSACGERHAQGLPCDPRREHGTSPTRQPGSGGGAVGGAVTGRNAANLAAAT